MADKEKTAAEAEEIKTEEPQDAKAADAADKKDKKKKDKKEKVDKKDEKIKELEDKVLRQMAEFENFRNRSMKEKAEQFELGAKSVIEKILPVIDNFERGLATLSEEQREEPFAQGIDKVYQQLLKELTDIGVKPIEAVGKEFDPELHNAVMQSESEEYESGIVSEELQKGYTYRDRVVRHSMVAVVS